MRVAVVFGSRSVEHDVSVITAVQAMGALREAGYEVLPVYITKEGRWLVGEGLAEIGVFREGRWEGVGREGFIPPWPAGGLLVKGSFGRWRLEPVDAVLPACHGTFGEDGTLQGLLELADLPYVGSGVVGSALGMDKVAMKAVFRAAGLPVGPYRAFSVWEWRKRGEELVKELVSDLGFPLFVKPANLGSSVGIAKATDEASLAFGVEVAARYSGKVIVEKAFQGFREVNCSVLGTEEPLPSPLEEPVPWDEFLSFEDKYLRGRPEEGMKGQRRIIPAPVGEELTLKIQAMAVRAFKAVDAAGVARVDFFCRPETGEVYVNEINTIPGSLSFYLWREAGIPFPELVKRLVDLALEVHREKASRVYRFDSGVLKTPGAGKLDLGFEAGGGGSRGRG